ncbi:MAG TPA: MFS transporter [Rugosibacter sp.]|nr:MFS transporter [Rugosibacter sp.]HQN47265.1 MFS transporter [Rugosibacter sp.]HQQ34445.1 MFS transporter [Rugosibacter sp.]
MSDQQMHAMTREEKRAGISLASIFALRMLGMFLILPVFAVHAQTLPGGTNLTLVGLALGAYGLTQAIFQIPFGMASDKFGRKRVIIVGLVLFAIGSVFAAVATDIYWTIFGRVLQGAGAISAAVTALAADLTREQHRTKVMAMIGSSIGLVFAFSLVAAPLLYVVIGMHGIFWMTGGLALAAIAVVIYIVPEPPPIHAGLRVPFREVLVNTQLLRLNLGIFILHMAQMMMFVVVPGLLISTGGLPLASHWQVYLPAVLISFVLMVPAIIYAEKRQKLRTVFVAGIVLLLLTLLMLGLQGNDFYVVAGGLLSFFVAFNLLEAMLPSLVSRVAPPQAKGAALGVYNTAQALGLFMGGALGGWIVKHYNAQSVFLFAAGTTLIWLAAAATMQAILPRQLAMNATKTNDLLV